MEVNVGPFEAVLWLPVCGVLSSVFQWSSAAGGGTTQQVCGYVILHLGRDRGRGTQQVCGLHWVGGGRVRYTAGMWVCT